MKTLIKNAKIITPEEIINGAVVITDSIITDIITSPIDLNDADEIIDANGSYIMPGIIDIHADDIEKELQPRPASIFPIEYAFRESEKKLINKGITTMFHSMSIYDSNYFGGKEIRTKDFVESIAKWINNNRDNGLIRHKFHLRYEVDNLSGVDYVMDLLSTDHVDLISFMDHTPGQGQYRDLKKFKEAMIGYDHITEAMADEILKKRMEAPIISKETLENIAKIAAKHNVSIASHDDDTREKIDCNISWGASISEFPITIDVAKYATSHGLDVIVGAPNIIMGGSHSGNLSAAEAIIDGCANILCSDYKPSSILGAVFYMHDKHGIDLVQMVNMATINPAKAVNIDHKLGSIEKSKVFDALQVSICDGLPIVEKVWVDGELTASLNYSKIKRKKQA